MLSKTGDAAQPAGSASAVIVARMEVDRCAYSTAMFQSSWLIGTILGSNPTESASIREIIEARMGRRHPLKGAAAGAAVGLLGIILPRPSLRAADSPSTLTLEEIEHGIDENIHVAKGYTANVLIRWGDKVTGGAPDFDISRPTAGPCSCPSSTPRKAQHVRSHQPAGLTSQMGDRRGRQSLPSPRRTAARSAPRPDLTIDRFRGGRNALPFLVRVHPQARAASMATVADSFGGAISTRLRPAFFAR